MIDAIVVLDWLESHSNGEVVWGAIAMNHHNQFNRGMFGRSVLSNFPVPMQSAVSMGLCFEEVPMMKTLIAGCSEYPIDMAVLVQESWTGLGPPEFLWASVLYSPKCDFHSVNVKMFICNRPYQNWNGKLLGTRIMVLFFKNVMHMRSSLTCSANAVKREQS